MLLLITYDVNTETSAGKVDLEKLQNNVLITVSEFRIRFSNVLLMQLRHTN